MEDLYTIQLIVILLSLLITDQCIDLTDKQPTDPALLQVRIPRSLRDEFMRSVKMEDDNASRLVRQWIREYLRERAQSDLFEGDIR